ncbi:helix-turn-helix domain-containing protein [Pseudonocardia ailaonensis]|uniref:Helix-turn-helix domain-containing protein n=1 Tax=Pseudonocardia ailaonensis TaxID=367279 RepID=A0ABN2N0H4_9PSEU
MSLRPGTVFLTDCPTRLTMEVITGKWAVIDLFALGDGPVRHGDLAELVGCISRKVLTQTLRRLQDNGLVERHVYAEAPPRVEYGLTELGRTLKEPIKMLTDWAVVHGEAVAEMQETAGRRAEDATGQRPAAASTTRDQRTTSSGASR